MTRKPPLSVTHPELAEQAHGWDPKQFTPRSNAKKRWRCASNHVWVAAICDRTRGSGCAVCSGKKVLSGYNDLLTTHPQIANEADLWDPSQFTFGSVKKMNWKCPLGHRYLATISNRTRGGNCPFCSNHQVLVGFNDLKTTHPELAAQVDGWEPKEYVAGSNKRLAWVCSSGHKWIATPNSRRVGNGCPVCSNHKVQVGVNDLATTHPILGLEADGWDPSMVVAGSNKRLRWRCNLGHIFYAAPSDRRDGGKCGVCANRSVLSGFNDLKTTHSALADEADGWNPSEYIAGTNKKMPWKCKFGHRWSAQISNRSAGGKCPFCTRKRSFEGSTDLKTTHPELAAQADGWDPSKILSGSGKKLPWRCSYGHRWSTTVANRTAGRGCPTCMNRELLPGTNDLKTTNPELAAQAYNWDPTTAFAGDNRKHQWICEKGHIWSATSNSRVNGNGCQVCSNKIVLQGFNDLKTTHPDLARQAFGWDPTKYASGGHHKLTWRCDQGHVWKAALLNRALGRGCPSCAKTGFDPNEKGYLYLLRHERWGLLKIGISNSETERTRAHEYRGWEIVDIRGVMDGLLSYEWEQSILRLLKTSGADLGRDSIAGKFDGYTESWVEKSFPVESIKELMDLVKVSESR